MIGRALLNFTALLFTAGSILLLFFILLAGAVEGSSLLTKWYWLAADTSSVPGADYPVSRWSLYGVCGYDGTVSHPGRLIGCTKNKAAYPYDPLKNFGSDGLPNDLTKQHSATFYETRFAFAFYLIALFFETMSLFLSLFSIKFRWAAFTNGSFQLMAFLFVTPAAALSTAAFTKGRDNFKAAGYDAKLGPALYGFAWAVVFMTIVNIVIYFVSAPANQSSGPRSWASRVKTGGLDVGKRSGYTFGFGTRKTTEGPTKAETSSFVRA